MVFFFCLVQGQPKQMVFLCGFCVFSFINSNLNLIQVLRIPSPRGGLQNEVLAAEVALENNRPHLSKNLKFISNTIAAPLVFVFLNKSELRRVRFGLSSLSNYEQDL